MYSKALALVLVICFCGVNAVTYQAAIDACRKEYNVQNDAPFDYFLANGKFESGQEKLKCYFSCMASKLETADSAGNMNGEKIKALSAENPTNQELKGFANDDIQKACIPAQASASTHCDKVFNFVECAVQAALKSKSS